jgi:adenosylcobyric acid synthase
VNLGLARHADLPVVVVGDIDRGGVFAAMYGTVALLEPPDQALMAGFVVNKFRGDATLLAPGLDELERLTARRVFGTLPWHPGLWLDSEDALDLDGRRARGDGATRRVVVVRLPRISNFTDVDALGLEPDLDVVFASDPRDLTDADLVVLPGTRATIADLAWLRSRGLDLAVIEHVRRGGALLGICGGFQMLGHEIADPDGIEDPAAATVAGLGLLDVSTSFEKEKTLALPTATYQGAPVSGYEIHHGVVSVGPGADEFPGGARSGRVLGTLWHGTLEGDALRGVVLSLLGEREPSTVVFSDARSARLDLLGDLVEEHLDVDALLALARDGAPPSLPTLPPGDHR